MSDTEACAIIASVGIICITADILYTKYLNYKLKLEQSKKK